MRLTTFRLFLGIAFICFLIATIVSATGGHFLFDAVGWIATGLALNAFGVLIGEPGTA